MHVTIAKVGEVFFDGEVVSATFPGAEGVLTVLPRHMPLVTTLKKGYITVRLVEGATHKFPVMDGIIEVRKDWATVIL